ncbi:MAG: DNA repair protein RecO [Desulfuromonas sp.]|nr:MAG: DNA repair protein RecO [Desulfuromonas sp.]
MQQHLSDAIILRHLDYGESDRIVTFFTPDLGLRKGFARGAKKSRKRFGPGLELFAQVRIHWTQPKSGELLSLREVELVDLRTGLRNDLEAVALAGYGCELVEELIGDDPGHPETFALLKSFLDHLAANGTTPEARLLFELRLLNQVGYVPHLLHCSECDNDLPAEKVAFNAGRGGSLCAGCATSYDRIRLARMTLGSLAKILHSPEDNFADIHLSPLTLREGGAAISSAIKVHLNRPLRSLPFLDQLLAESDRQKPAETP